MRYIALLLCAVLAFPGGPAMGASPDDAWGRLSKLSSTSYVTIHLRDGRSLNGTVQGVKPESLEFAESKHEIRVKRADIMRHNDDLAMNKSVEFRLRNDRVVGGKIIQLRDDSLTLIDSGNIVQLKRPEIQRIRQRVHGRAALIGLAVGAGAGAVGGAASSTPASQGIPSKQTRAGNAAEGAGIFGVIGAVVMGVIGIQKTLYQSPAPRP